jgi:electron transport complex protein RnfB
MRKITPEQIDEILPQTQCGLCGYGGCMPYAEALVFENAAINLCPPGGVPTLRALGDLLDEDARPYLAEMHEKAKPKMLAVIREAECIGCTKCIAACPVDAIIGSAKQMHSIIASNCTGCELCIAPCPVDCIDMVLLPNQEIDTDKANLARERFNTRNKRITQEKREARTLKSKDSIHNKKNYIQDAIARAKAKKSISG